MEGIARKIGIGIVMIVPTFVGAGALWSIVHSYVLTAIWVVVMAGLCGGVITGRLFGVKA